MAVLDRLFGRDRSGPNPQAQISGMIRVGATYFNARYNFARVLNQVYGNPTGYACINTIVNDFSRPQWMVSTVDEPEEVAETADAVALLKILDQPSEMSSGTSMQRDIAMDLELNGRSVWLKLRSKNRWGDKGPLTGLKRLPCENLTVITNMERDLVGFFMTTDAGIRIPLTPSEVFYFHYAHPQNRWEGYPPAYIAGLPAEVDQRAKQFNWRLLENDGAVPGYITVEGLTPQQFQEFKALWESGADPGRTRFLGGGGKATYVAVGQSNKDMAYDSLRDMSQDDICKAFGMSSLVLNPTDATFANGDIARVKYIKTKCGSMWSLIADQFTRQIQLDFPGLHVGFDLSNIDELNEALDARVERAIKLFQAGLASDDEGREMVGLGPLHEAKGFFVQVSTVQARSADHPALNPSPAAADNADPADGNDGAELASAAKEIQLMLDQQMKELSKAAPEPDDLPPGIRTQADKDAHDLYNARMAPYQAAATEKMKMFYERQQQAIVAKITSQRGKSIEKALGKWWDPERWQRELSDAAKLLYVDVVLSFGVWTMSNLTTSKTFDVKTTKISAYINTRADEQAQLVNDHTYEQIQSAIDELDGDTVSVDDIAGAVNDYFDNNSDNRSNLWGMYEVASAAGFATLSAGEQAEMLGKYWIGGECPICADNAGEGVIPIDESFDSGDDAPLAHFGCNCDIGFDALPEAAK